MSRTTTRRRHLRAAAVAATSVLLLSGCASGTAADGKTVITLAGPNQWNSNTTSFGPAWEELVAAFEKAEPDIEVQTTVLPIGSAYDTLSTQLAAGTAPALVFNQASYTPEQIVPLDPYLAEPNPYVEGNERWLDLFNPDSYGDAQRNGNGELEFIPLNLVLPGLFFNEDAFAEAGVSAPIESVGDLLDACAALSEAGYTPLAMDSNQLGSSWTSTTLLSMLMNPLAEEINVYAVDGTEGTAPVVTPKSMTRAIMTGQIDMTETPAVAEGAELLKSIFDECATPNWSGVAASSSFIGGEEFLAGDAAMAWGTTFAIGNLDDVDWAWSSMPFPTVTRGDTPLSDGTPARFGAVAGGTSYMIPATTSGDELEAAVKFLQFATSIDGGGPWVQATGAIPSIQGVEAEPTVLDLAVGEWAQPRVFEAGMLGSAEYANTNIWEGYLLGTKTLDEQLEFLQGIAVTGAHEAITYFDWSEESWATE
ncbi:ABC transporter substrate-binding protein [Microbacterium allomyrinae]|uniref:Extracellular solute-binding protein n=1 Tax=Microbacterium allomyrinae TaxID=2830666 RepID=A0A9X1LTP9_9MICO|nr:extracellular solute-binding protein [Microbacterium allomyrinae]MCC2031578.1 extracellular solute-binding protein [Microbacterium allomyrinae]